MRIMNNAEPAICNLSRPHGEFDTKEAATQWQASLPVGSCNHPIG